MTGRPDDLSDYEPAEILTVSDVERRRLARRWTVAVLSIQTAIVAILLNAFWVPSVFSAAAMVAWPTSVVVCPLLVIAASLAAGRSVGRTIALLAVSIGLTGLPWLAVALTIGSPGG